MWAAERGCQNHLNAKVRQSGFLELARRRKFLVRNTEYDAQEVVALTGGPGRRGGPLGAARNSAGLDRADIYRVWKRS